jgi:predicted N-acyltransferase
MHEWLEAFEISGCVGFSTGWQPIHLLLYANTPNNLNQTTTALNSLIAAVPLYLKYHSQGEFIFDHSWADFSQDNGVRYYPKLLAAVPMTPQTGQRILFKNNYNNYIKGQNLYSNDNQ